MLDVAQLVPTLEAAREIGVSSRTLARWAREGTVKPTLVTAGGQYRWDVPELERQLRELREGEDQA